ncbi:MAG: type II toxin-antitoxin system VapC family toxin [Actinomycetota bacterium]|nr:type II toxin-antitoxin system VapC family toxin [Actinomycetota bacterium]
MADEVLVTDTDVIIGFLRGRDPGSGTVRKLIARGHLRITAVTAFELRLGADFLDREHRIMALLRGKTLPMDLLAGIHAGDIYSRLRASGLEIGIKDSLQAGVCRRFDIPLCTGNVRHFERVAGLRLVPIAEER